MKKTAITWLNYNRQDLSEAMEAQFEPHPDVDIYIIDNASPDIETKATREHTKVIRLDVNKFLSGGWNRCMKHLQDNYEYVWQMNDDVINVSTDMALKLTQVMDANPHLQVITPCFNSPHGTFHHHPKDPEVTIINWVDWCLPFVRSSGWKKVGGMDEDFKSYGADLAICRRYKDLGFKNCFAKINTLSAHHLISQTICKDDHMRIQMCDVTEMNRLLKQKFGVQDWSQMI